MMHPNARLAVVIALGVCSGSAYGQADQPPGDLSFPEQIQRLGPKNDKATRLKALGWINANSAKKGAADAVAALEKCIRADPDGEVRQKAVLALCLIVKETGKPCPLVILEALHDKEDFVRYQAAECTALFKTFAPGAVGVLLRATKSENAELRSTSLLILARAAGKDPKAVEAIEKAKEDKVFDVRHSAHLAMFTASDKLDELLTYLIRVREDPASVLTPGPEDSDIGKRERAERNLVLLGSAMRLIEWSDTRADELATVLMKLLADRSAVMRRGAANLIGAVAVKVELPAKRDSAFPIEPSIPFGGSNKSLLPLLDPNADLKKKDAPLEKSKVALGLEKMEVEAALRKLREDDPDRSVRDAARLALERLAGLKEKKQGVPR